MHCCSAFARRTYSPLISPATLVERLCAIHASCHKEVSFPTMLSHMVSEPTALLKGEIKLGGLGGNFA